MNAVTIRQAIDSVLEGYCEHQFGRKFEELLPADQAALLDQFARECGVRSYRIQKRMRAKYAGVGGKR